MNPATELLALLSTSNTRANAETVRCPNCSDQGWYYRLVVEVWLLAQCPFCHSEPNSVFNRVRELNARDEALKVLVEGMAHNSLRQSGCFVYVIIFLRNAGERIRAVFMAAKVFGITATEAGKWVDSVKLDRIPTPNDAAKATFKEYPCDWMPEMEPGFELRVSHWPEQPNDALSRALAILKGGGGL